MFFENNLKQKIGLIISNAIFILISAFQFINHKPTDEVQITNNIITVYIIGEVNNPNLYEIESNKRLNDLIILAGGLTEQADLNSLNLALSLSDEMKITIPSKNSNPTNNDNPNNNGKININTASISDLDKLHGIGEAKAKAIIEYREKYGPFAEIGHIRRVDGIGDVTYENIKDNICV
jgi:competence protein ComEA